MAGRIPRMPTILQNGIINDCDQQLFRQNMLEFDLNTITVEIGDQECSVLAEYSTEEKPVEVDILNIDYLKALVTFSEISDFAHTP